MAEIASAYVSVLPSARGFGSKLDGQISGDMDKSGKKAGSRFGGAMKAGLLGAAGIAAGAGVLAGKLIGDALGEAREAQVIGARTENVIKKMGGAANISAKQVGDLAGAISAKTGIDDEAIQAGQNLLLTFGNIRNEAGKGNDIFNQTSRLMTDMSAAMGTDAKGSAIQLGKALNDPVKGISALSRVGVSFTEGQKETIKALVETGDTMGAQKVILGELERQFGGAAEAMATPGDKAKVAFGNLKEELGTRLLPIVDKVMTFFVDKGVPAISNLMDSLGKGSPIIKTVGNFVKNTLLPPIQDLAGWVMDSLVPAIQDFARDALPAVKDALGSVKKGLSSAQPFFEFLGNVVTDILLPVLGKLARIILPILGDQIEILGKAFGALGRIGTALWNKALQPAFKFIVGAIANILDMWSSMLGTLAKVPGFGWAKKAADSMANAADKARDVAEGIKKIPTSKTVTVTTVYMTRSRAKERSMGDADYLPRLAGLPGKNEADAIMLDYGDQTMESFSRGLVKGAKKSRAALTKELESLKSKLSTLKSDFAALAESVASSLTGDLFGVSAVEADAEAGIAAKSVGQAFVDNLMAKKGELTALLSSFKTLQGWGIPASFLSQLFASGNGALITELAGMGQAGAVSTASLFGEVTNLGQQLGNAVAANDYGPDIRDTTDEIKKLREDIADLPKKAAKENAKEMGNVRLVLEGGSAGQRAYLRTGKG